MEPGLNRKVALVTGASRGIGAAIAMELAREGVHICLVARDPAKRDEVAGGVRDSPDVRTTGHAADPRTPDSGGATLKATILNFTKAMADIGVKDGVRVNAINPGLIEADRFTHNVVRTMRDRSLGHDAAIAFLLSSHCATRVGRPDEIGAMTAFLASDKADFIQGSVIDVDGEAMRSL